MWECKYTRIQYSILWLVLVWKCSPVGDHTDLWWFDLNCMVTIEADIVYNQTDELLWKP